MAKKNNKGFSLIEIVIAIAILTLLLTPIIKQFAQTMKVSRQAKEQQYVNEEAVFALEEAQVTPEKEFEASCISYVADNPGSTFSTSTDAVSCELVDINGAAVSIVDDEGNPVLDSTGAETDMVQYAVNKYSIGNIEIGSRNTAFDKVVTIDNLATQIRGYKTELTDKGLSIKYNIPKDQVPVGYTLTNEGCAVKRDGNGNVISVVVEETDFIGNPNDTNLGNMQNLDYETVAMINGTAANFDVQAETTLFSKAMDALKEIDYAAWEQGMLHNQGKSVLDDADYYPNMQKLTKIFVDDITEADGTTSYLVKVDVFYNCNFTLYNNPANYREANLTFNVFTQKFNTEKCPDIYFEYQPFMNEITGSAGSYNVNYAENDYILIDSYVEGVKLYLYKPFLDAENMSQNKTENDYNQESAYEYTTNVAGVNKRVKIHVAKAHNDIKNVNIFTNIYAFDLPGYRQFYVDALAFKPTFNSVVSDDPAYASSVKQSYDMNLIKPISQDTRYDDRLRTVTVTMVPVNEAPTTANSVTLSGAKGEK